MAEERGRKMREGSEGRKKRRRKKVERVGTRVREKERKSR